MTDGWIIGIIGIVAVDPSFAVIIIIYSTLARAKIWVLWCSALVQDREVSVR